MLKGPYLIHDGDVLDVDIDDDLWGVLIMSDDHVAADVWIDDYIPTMGN